MMSATTTASPKKRKRHAARITSLDALIGAHPQALREIYTTGTPCDPSLLNTYDSRLLSLEPLRATYMLTRPLLRKVARDWLPGDGRQFETGGTGGTMRLVADRKLRFHCQAAASQLDGKPCLQLAYQGFDNPWPVRNMVEELRLVGDGVAIGPGMLAQDGRVLWWWGISDPNV